MRLKLCYLVAGWPGIAVPSGSAQLPTYTRRSSPSYHCHIISINIGKRSVPFLPRRSDDLRRMDLCWIMEFFSIVLRCLARLKCWKAISGWLDGRAVGRKSLGDPILRAPAVLIIKSYKIWVLSYQWVTWSSCRRYSLQKVHCQCSGAEISASHSAAIFHQIPKLLQIRYWYWHCWWALDDTDAGAFQVWTCWRTRSVSTLPLLSSMQLMFVNAVVLMQNWHSDPWQSLCVCINGPHSVSGLADQGCTMYNVIADQGGTLLIMIIITINVHEGAKWWWWQPAPSCGWAPSLPRLGTAGPEETANKTNDDSPQPPSSSSISQDLDHCHCEN